MTRQTIWSEYPSDPQQWTPAHDKREFLEAAIDSARELCGALEEFEGQSHPTYLYIDAALLLKELEEIYYGPEND